MSYLTAQEVAALWQVDHKTVYAEITAGRLGCVRVGPARRTIRIPPAALAAWEAEQLGSTAAPAPLKLAR
jgi:excisionase family DNA binding protein